jgi:hypothetical protein
VTYAATLAAADAADAARKAVLRKLASQASWNAQYHLGEARECERRGQTRLAELHERAALRSWGVESRCEQRLDWY